MKSMTTRTAIFLVGAAFLAAAACSNEPDARPDQNVIERDLKWVSLIDLLANQEKYHGKQIGVYGVVALGFENFGIFPSYDLAHSSINGIWIEDGVPQEYLTRVGESTKKGDYGPLWFEGYVTGTFDATMRGHLGMWQGTLRNISRFEVKSKEAIEAAEMEDAKNASR